MIKNIWTSTWGTINWNDTEENIIRQINQLVERGADVNDEEPREFHDYNPMTHICAHYTGGRHQFLIACSKGYNNVIKEFLKLGVYPDTRYHAGHTALMEVVGQSNIEAAKALINAGADINARGKYGDTVWSHAEDAKKSKEMLDMLNWELDRPKRNRIETLLDQKKHPKPEPIEEVKVETKCVKNTDQRKKIVEELKALRKEFTSEAIRTIIPNTEQRLKVRKLRADAIRSRE